MMASTKTTRRLKRCVICRGFASHVGQLVTEERTHWFGLCEHCHALDADTLAAAVAETCVIKMTVRRQTNCN
jgi:hypothetical protein